MWFGRKRRKPTLHPSPTFLHWNKQHIWGEWATCCQHLNAVPGRGVLIDGFKAMSVNYWTKLSGGWNVKRARLQEAGLVGVGSCGKLHKGKNQNKILQEKNDFQCSVSSHLAFSSSSLCNDPLRKRGQELLTPFYRGSESVSDLPRIIHLFIGAVQNRAWSPGFSVTRKMRGYMAEASTSSRNPSS